MRVNPRITKERKKKKIREEEDPVQNMTQREEYTQIIMSVGEKMNQETRLLL